MTDKLPTATYIFVDRRKTGRGKSLPNRQRLLRRIKDAIRDSKPKDIDAGGVKGSATGNRRRDTGRSRTSPVSRAEGRTCGGQVRWGE